MSSKFDAEEVIRDLASGAFPNEGDILIRGADGWVFGVGEDLEIEIDLEDVGGRLDDRLRLPAAIAYEDEVNLFTKRNTFSGQLSAPDFEALMRFTRR